MSCLLALSGANTAAAFSPVAPPPPDHAIVHDAKFVCGQTPEGFKCRNEPGAIRRGKMRKIPKSGSSGSSGSGGSGWFGGSRDDAEAPLEAPAAGAGAAGSGAAGGTASGCPPNSERLGGHCIPYTQTCRRGLAANTPPQVCQRAEEKLVCDFRADGLKDCCCRTYSQF